MAFFKILESDAVSSEPVRMYVKHKSNEHAAQMSVVGHPFLPLKFGASLLGIFTLTCIPSIAPIQSCSYIHESNGC